MKRILGPLLALTALGLAYTPRDSAAAEADAPLQWWRGNTHTHTLWSDGDAPPEVAASWYKNNGYDFLVLSDHNVMSKGERWFPISEDGKRRLHPEHLTALQERFGVDWVELRQKPERREMRLKTLDELSEYFEVPGDFIFIPGEEVTSSFRDASANRNLPVHINAVNLYEQLKPAKGGSAREVMNAAVDSIVAAGEKAGRPIFAHINHPNFGWGLSWEDVAHVAGDRFFEVYNGHRGVRNHGDKDHPSMEEMWDKANTLRLTELKLPIMYGVATDDAHEYWKKDTTSIPGRGWVMVHASELDPDSIVRAMQAGDFYASNGVELQSIQFDGKTYSVTIDGRAGDTHETVFSGTRMLDGKPTEIGVELARTTANPALYEVQGDELFVRATVISSRDKKDPYAKGEKEMAWAQPVAIEK